MCVVAHSLSDQRPSPPVGETQMKRNGQIPGRRGGEEGEVACQKKGEEPALQDKTEEKKRGCSRGDERAR